MSSETIINPGIYVNINQNSDQSLFKATFED